MNFALSTINPRAMRYIGSSILLAALACMIYYTAAAQTLEATLTEVERAIAAGDAQALAKYFNADVEINIEDKEQVYNRTQAAYVTREFFMKYPVKTFRILHKGSSGDHFYAVGEYFSQRGKFDTNIFIKKSANGFVIETLRFDKGK